MPPQTITTGRTSIGLPTERAEQLRSLAEARGLSTTALIEFWINRALVEGEPGAIELPGYGAFRDDDALCVTIAGHALPLMNAQKAMLLAAVLDGAAGTAEPIHEFKLPVGRAVPVDLDAATLTIGRHGRGVVFVLADKVGEKAERFAAPSSYVTDLALMIRTAANIH